MSYQMISRVFFIYSYLRIQAIEHFLNLLTFPFIFCFCQVECEQVSYAYVHGSLEHAPNYILHIYPPAVLHNYLPYNIRYASEVRTIKIYKPDFS